MLAHFARSGSQTQPPSKKILDPPMKTSLDLNEARVDGVLGYSGISWTIRKQPAPRWRQITALYTESLKPPHHSILTGRMPFLPPNQQHQQITEGSAL